MSKQFILDTLYKAGFAFAKELQNRAGTMAGTELYAEEENIPSFTAACAKMNMLERTAGFVCKSSAGRVVRLIQPYDSSIYTAEPEELPAQWGFVWSTDPIKAKPFVSIATSPYNIGECCTENGAIYRSTVDNNVFAPSEYSYGWELINIER